MLQGQVIVVTGGGNGLGDGFFPTAAEGATVGAHRVARSGGTSARIVRCSR